MRTIFYIAAGALLALVILSPDANAQTCAEHSKVIANLEKTYSETPVSMGLASNGSLIEILASKNTGTFTIIMTLPNGVSCVMAAGESWEDLPKRVAGPAA